MTVSVVIPAYNAGRFIGETIQSVLDQDHPAHEIIVVNDGSTDMDYRGLERLSPKVRVLCQSNRGVSAARNAGCDSASGDYVAILDADDVWLPWKLGMQARYLSAHPDCAAVFGRGLHWRPGPRGWSRPAVRRAQQEPSASSLTYPDFLLGIPVCPSTMVVRRSVWQEIGGFDESLSYGEDIAFNLDLSVARKVAVFRDFLTLYRSNDGSATTRLQDENHLAAVLMGAVESIGSVDAFGNAADMRLFSARIAEIHRGHGYRHFWGGKMRIARKEYWTASLIERKRKDLLYFLLSHVPGARIALRALRKEDAIALPDTVPDARAAIVEIPRAWAA